MTEGARAPRESFRRAFGPRAEAWYRQLGDAPVLLCDLDEAGDALYAALQMRMRGERFYAGIVIDDPRAALMVPVGRSVFGQARTKQDISILLDSFGHGGLVLDRPQADYEKVSFHHVGAAQDLLRLSEGLLVRSYTEFARLRSVAEWLPRRTVFDVRRIRCRRPCPRRRATGSSSGCPTNRRSAPS